MKKYLVLVFFTALLILVPAAISQEGEIYVLTVNPSEPKVFEPTAVSVGVKNTGKFEQDYKLKIRLVKDGLTKDKSEYTFTLGPNQGTFFAPTFFLNDIGEFTVVARLFDQHEINLITEKVVSFIAVSEIGPFDLQLDVPTDVARPGQILPLILTMANMGERGTDVEIRIELPCFNQTKIENTFFLFLDGHSSLERLTSIPTCQEEGLHNIFAHIILFNKSFLTSVNQIFINKTVAQVVIVIEEELELKKGETKIFTVSVNNNGTSTIHNLRLLIERIPLSWTTISPESIRQVEPAQTVLFIVSLTLPEEVQQETYPIRVAAAADEYLKRADSKIKVLQAQAVLKQPAAAIPFFDSLSKTVSENSLAVIAVVVALLGIVLAISFMRRREKRYSYADKLKKLRGIIK